MSDYQRQKNNKYILPTSVYHQILWQVRDYYRIKEAANDILEESPPPSDGMPHGSPSADGIFNKVARREKYISLIDMIDAELARIPKEYQRGVWNNILYRTAFPLDADRTTYARYKSRMIYGLAERQGLI